MLQLYLFCSQVESIIGPALFIAGRLFLINDVATGIFLATLNLVFLVLSVIVEDVCLCFMCLLRTRQITKFPPRMPISKNAVKFYIGVIWVVIFSLLLYCGVTLGVAILGR